MNTNDELARLIRMKHEAWPPAVEDALRELVRRANEREGASGMVMQPRALLARAEAAWGSLPPETPFGVVLRLIREHLA